MSQKTYRVIQWMTGDVGRVAVRHFAENPVFDLVGVLVHSKDKVGRDAGEIAGTGPIGVAATDDVDAAMALDADCVFYTPVIMDVDTVCRLLRTGKNVVTTAGFFHPSRDFREAGEQIRAACGDGGASFHGGGIHPGYAGDLLPLTLARVMSRIDSIHVYEVVDVVKDAPVDHIDWMGFGKDKDAFLAEPTILGLGLPFFAQSMYMIADGLGVTIDEVTAADIEAATAVEAIPHAEGAIPKGTVAAQRHEWTAWVDGRPLIVFHAIYVSAGPDLLDPPWDWGDTRYEIVIDGAPPDRADPQRSTAARRRPVAPRLRVDGHGRDQRDSRGLRRPTGLAQSPRPRPHPPPRSGPPMTADPKLHHVVFAVAPDRRAAAVQMFTDLGFAFNTAELAELGIHVHLDWDRGIELISPIPGSDGSVAASVTEFLDRHGDGVYTVVIRVPDAAASETVAERFGSATRFRQSFSGGDSYLDEIDLSVLGLPLTLLSTNVS